MRTIATTQAVLVIFTILLNSCSSRVLDRRPREVAGEGSLTPAGTPPSGGQKGFQRAVPMPTPCGLSLSSVTMAELDDGVHDKGHGGSEIHTITNGCQVIPVGGSA